MRWKYYSHFINTKTEAEICWNLLLLRIKIHTFLFISSNGNIVSWLKFCVQHYIKEKSTGDSYYISLFKTETQLYISVSFFICYKSIWYLKLCLSFMARKMTLKVHDYRSDASNVFFPSNIMRAQDMCWVASGYKDWFQIPWQRQKQQNTNFSPKGSFLLAENTVIYDIKSQVIF